MTTAEEYEAAFHGIELPQGPISLGAGMSIPDVQVFLSKQLTILRTSSSDRVKEPVR